MAKIKHNNPLDTIDKIIQDATDEGLLHLHADDKEFEGRYISLKGRKLFQFGTTSYLGLGHDPRLKQAAIDAIRNYGTQFPLSKTYISHPLYSQLESLIEEIYKAPIIITKNSTLGHLAVIPTAVRDNDAIILDHQVHWSVQNAAQILKTRDVPVRMIRHNDLNMLEHQIKALKDKVNKIWYMADGVYSMYGDYAPFEALDELCAKYPQLHLYYDDVHGMGWKGPHGGGAILDHYKEIPDHILVFGTLSKTFGASGAVLVCPDKELHRKIKNYGGPLTFSAQLEPASVGAAIAAAKIHLSDEIYTRQFQLQERIQYFNKLLKTSDLPLVHDNDSPVFFIGTGSPATGYYLVRKLMQHGFFVNLGLYPAVPVKNTGVRITISSKNKKKDILRLFTALESIYPEAIEKTGTSLGAVKSAFGLKKSWEHPIKTGTFKVELFRSIDKISKSEWDERFKGNGIFDYNGVRLLEESFQGNPKPEGNWDFYYIRILDNNKPVLLSFFTGVLWKNDMLLPEYVSQKVERIRAEDYYYQTSRVLCMGSLVSEGDHLWVDREYSRSEKLLEVFLKTVEDIKEKIQAEAIVLRDFDPGSNFEDLIKKSGYIPMEMPDSCIHKLGWEKDDFKSILSKRNRRHLKNDILKYKDLINIKHTEVLTQPDLKQAYKLYQQVKDQNLALNTFYYPYKFFEELNTNKNWEFLVVYHPANGDELIGVMFNYRNDTTYIPALVGLNYRYNQEFALYRQLLFATLKAAKTEGFEKVELGFSANFEKQKLGAEIKHKLAFIQMDDNYKMEALQAI
ncbi:MAG: bifunctional aminotransferase class I/II-fold pyridoxal phosphate-dependent enzyme/GNAT family N-acetyltransferase [Salegentibacter sp.]|uniref:bifunctional aminotransferase class I/II-fold pyridoxal phosphate-dependent enzyme/GNAT family N-acetyltransferase n=1 Tax=Salegentibacter sp. TaxID=1903072 RepID=UPI00286FCAAA|nr:bifunctional aminotransferase class I/II-fold pyridoxal phosphate-dependent enzyme/GNAT family N-acetyltransferase [Salegentibacter sp.]MDR9458271.1 bifunctional aminotransferase class I/II-fold pyridoxal phosphate-dependent enzyme/GNAT family N-acetyltransferase [Salegentibacter sp.]